MFTTNPQSPKGALAPLLREAKIVVRQSNTTQGGELHELDPDKCDGRQTLVFDNGAQGVTAAVRVDLPVGSALRGIASTSSDALSLLGALTFALKQHDARAELISGERGLEAVLISRHRCDGGDASTLKEFVEGIHGLARVVEPALSGAGQALIDAILRQVRPVTGAMRPEQPEDRPIIVPTYDKEARNRMMQEQAKK